MVDIAARKMLKHGFNIWDPDSGLSLSSMVSMGSANWARMQDFVALISEFWSGGSAFLFWYFRLLADALELCREPLIFLVLVSHYTYNLKSQIGPEKEYLLIDMKVSVPFLPLSPFCPIQTQQRSSIFY